MERFHCVELHAPLKRQASGASYATEKEKDKEADFSVFEHCGSTAQLQLKKRDATSPAIDPSIKQFRKVATLEEAQVGVPPKLISPFCLYYFFKGIFAYLCHALLDSGLKRIQVRSPNIGSLVLFLASFLIHHLTIPYQSVNATPLTKVCHQSPPLCPCTNFSIS